MAPYRCAQFDKSRSLPLPHTHTHTHNASAVGPFSAVELPATSTTAPATSTNSELPCCLAAELTAASESNLQYAISKVFSVSRSKGRKGCRQQAWSAGLQVHLRPLVRLFVPLSSCRGANILCCVVVVVVVVFGLVLFCVLVSKLLSHYYVYCSSFRLSFACRKLWALILVPSCTLVSPSRLGCTL